MQLCAVLLCGVDFVKALVVPSHSSSLSLFFPPLPFGKAEESVTCLVAGPAFTLDIVPATGSPATRVPSGLTLAPGLTPASVAPFPERASRRGLFPAHAILAKSSCSKAIPHFFPGLVAVDDLAAASSSRIVVLSHTAAGGSTDSCQQPAHPGAEGQPARELSCCCCSTSSAGDSEVASRVSGTSTGSLPRGLRWFARAGAVRTWSC